MLQSKVRVLYVRRYEIPNEGKEPTKGCKVFYLAPSTPDADTKGMEPVSVNGPYELFEKFAPQNTPGEYTLSFGQRMSKGKVTLTLAGVS